MKVALIGATGFVGSAVLKELLQRGHEVVALVRDPAKLAAQPRLQAVQADVLDAAAVQRVRDWLEDLGWAVQAVTDSPITGGDGNVEFLLWGKRASSSATAR